MNLHFIASGICLGGIFIVLLRMRHILRKGIGNEKNRRKTLLDLQSCAYALRKRWGDPSHPQNVSGSEAEELEKLIDKANKLGFDIKTPRLLLPSALSALTLQGRIYDFEQARTSVEMICRKTENEIQGSQKSKKYKVRRFAKEGIIVTTIISVCGISANVISGLIQRNSAQEMLQILKSHDSSGHYLHKTPRQLKTILYKIPVEKAEEVMKNLVGAKIIWKGNLVKAVYSKDTQPPCLAVLCWGRTLRRPYSGLLICEFDYSYKDILGVAAVDTTSPVLKVEGTISWGGFSGGIFYLKNCKIIQ